jgi:hypothetical protein
MLSEERPKLLTRIVGSTWHIAGTGVALVASVVALTFTLWPGLIPDPRGILAANLSVQTVEPGVTLGAYDTEYHPDQLAGLDAYDKALPGNVVYLHIQVQGKKHGNVTLDTVEYGWASRRRLTVPAKLPSGRGYTPNTPNDQWIAPIWIPDPGLGVPFFERLLLFDGDVLLAFVDTPRIANQR